jgi:WD40 repeat protein
VCGGAGGLLRIFERSDDPREEFRCTKSYRVEGDESAIVQLALAPSEETLVCSTLNHMAYTFALGSTDMVVGAADASFRYFETLTGSAAHGPSPMVKSAAINGMDVCVWKPLLATCGRDLTVRVWNYEEKTVVLTKRFKEEPLSLSLHPSGLFVVVGFTDKVRLMSILMDDLRTVRELAVKACRECRFARGGHAFAVANHSNVLVVDFYTCAVKFNLRGHQQAVRALKWADGDRKLVTVGKDGNAFLWDARTGARVQESMQPRTAFTTAALAGDAASPTSLLFAVAADNTIKAFGAAAMAPDNQVSGVCVFF